MREIMDSWITSNVCECFDSLGVRAQILNQICASPHLGPLVVTEESFAILKKVFIDQMLIVAIHCETFDSD